LVKEWPEVLTPKQAAEYLQVVDRTIHRMIERGDLHAVKIGRVWRIRKIDVDEYLKKQIEGRGWVMSQSIDELIFKIRQEEREKALQELQSSVDKQNTPVMSGLDQLPDILTAKHIAEYLSLSRKRVYELFQIIPTAGGIPNFDIGASKRVDKQEFIKWIDDRKQEKIKSLRGNK
jgi:excisionase family DNA binding protein